MLAEETGTYVEQLDVLIEDRRLDRKRRHAAKAKIDALASAADVRKLTELLHAIERQAEAASSGDITPGSPSGSDSSRREIERVRRYLRAREHEYRRKRQRVERLEERLLDAEGGGRTVTTFRLHFTDHFVDFSPERFVSISRAQRMQPMLVSKKHGRRRWWYRDRLWWDDGGMTAREIASAILELELERELDMHLLEEARTAALGTAGASGTARALPETVQQVVWLRDRGRCVDCGSKDDVRFDFVTPAGPGPTTVTPDDVQIRCRTCSALRVHGLAWGRGEA